MLQRHKWCFRTRHPLYLRFALGAKHEYQHVHNRRRTVTHSSQPDNARRNSQSKSPSLSTSDRDSDTTTKQPAQRNDVHVTRAAEPWIDPSSLTKSLEAHREANRNGITRGGIFGRNLQRRPRKHLKDKPQFGPWVGMNVLHVAPTSPVLVSDIDQNGTSSPLLSEWRSSELLPAQLRLPWLFRSDTKTKKGHVLSAEERLCAEIEACDKYFTPSSTERRAAVTVFTEIQTMILPAIDPDVCVDLIGSRASGVDGPCSDLDINVRAPMGQSVSKERNLSRERLLKIKRSLNEEQFADRIILHNFLDKAQVPIITGTHLLSGLEFQIQNTSDTRGSLEVARAFIAEFPCANVLFKIVRQILMMRGLTQSFYRGVTSYPLLNMIVTSLKLAPPRVLASGIASQLLHVLDFWSEFDTEKNKIVLASPMSTNMNLEQNGHAIDPISAIPKIARKPHDKDAVPHLLSLEDPADPSNDLGKRAYRIKHVQACFFEARNNIRAAMREWNRNLTRSEHDQDALSLLDWCLAGDYTAYEESRLQLRKYGEEATFSITDA